MNSFNLKTKSLISCTIDVILRTTRTDSHPFTKSLKPFQPTTKKEEEEEKNTKPKRKFHLLLT